MKDTLRKLFDYQRFAGNKRLEVLIDRAEFLHSESLSDDDLEYVCAAGDIDAERIGKEDEEHNGSK